MLLWAAVRVVRVATCLGHSPITWVNSNKLQTTQLGQNLSWGVGGFARHARGMCLAHYFCINYAHISTATITSETCDAYLKLHMSALHMTPMELMGMECMKCVKNNGKWGQWWKGYHPKDDPLHEIAYIQVYHTLLDLNLGTKLGLMFCSA